MTSFGTPELVVGSVSSAYSIRDSIESCQCLQHRHLFYAAHASSPSIDRRSQLMCSSARVVSVGLRTDDEPSLADDNAETPSTSHPGTRTPRVTLVRDLEDGPFIPTYPYLRPPVHTLYKSDREVQAPARGHGSVDERSPLLSRVSSETAPQPTAAWHPPNSIPAKPSAIGQSTFRQTVSRRVYVSSQVHSV